MIKETNIPEKIRIIATNKKYERAPIYLAPIMGSNKKLLSGFENNINVSEREREEMTSVFPLSEEEEISVRHLEILDLSIPHDRAKFYFTKTQSFYIAQSKTEVKPGQHRFYLENKVVEAKIKVDLMSIKRKATELSWEIIDGGEEKIKDTLRLFGIPFKGFTLVQLQESILNKAEKDSSLFIKMLGDRYREQRIFISKLVDQNLVTRTKSKSFVYEGNVIAISETAMIEFLDSSENKNLVGIWAKELGEDTKNIKVNETKAANYSTELDPKGAKKRILEFKDGALLQEFIMGEERTQILDIANQQLLRLKE